MHIFVQNNNMESLESDFQNSKISSKTFYNTKSLTQKNLVSESQAEFD